MSLTEDMMKKIKEEIANDPDHVGYAGKTDAEIAVLLSSNVVVNRVVQDILPPPINRILAGMGEGPNTVVAKDVTNAAAVSLGG